MFSRWLVGCSVVALALSSACAAPTLPLPPPELPLQSAGLTADSVRLSSDRGALPDAIIIIFNTNPSVPRSSRVSGAQAGAEGSWQAEVPAKVGDCLEITQTYRNDTSPPIVVCVRKP